jgi:hypothetical protein
MTMPLTGFQLNTPHEATDTCWQFHCYSHNVDELRIGKPHLVCDECRHVYPTKRALIKAWRAGMRSMFRTMRKTCAEDGARFSPGEALALRASQLIGLYTVKVDNIYYCPLCAHDF